MLGGTDRSRAAFVQPKDHLFAVFLVGRDPFNAMASKRVDASRTALCLQPCSAKSRKYKIAQRNKARTLLRSKHETRLTLPGSVDHSCRCRLDIRT